MITLAQILGGLCGLLVAYGMYRFVETVDEKQRERDAQRHAEELRLYKEQLAKSAKYLSGGHNHETEKTFS